MSLVPAFDLDNASSSTSVIDICLTVSDALSHFADITTVSLGPNLTSVISCYAASSPPSNPFKCLGVGDNNTLILCSNVFQSAESAYLCQFIPMTAILMEYGFQADYSFTNSKNLFTTRRGRASAHCPGTAAWSSLSGFPEAGISNVFKGCVNNTESTFVGGAPTSVVIAHWSTPASLTPLVFMWPAVIVGAGLSWNKQTHFDYVNSSLGVLIDMYLVKVPDCGFGNALMELGRCETWLTRQMRGQDNTDLSNLPPLTTGHGSALHQLMVQDILIILEKIYTDVKVNVFLCCMILLITG